MEFYVKLLEDLRARAERLEAILLSEEDPEPWVVAELVDLRELLADAQFAFDVLEDIEALG